MLFGNIFFLNFLVFLVAWKEILGAYRPSPHTLAKYAVMLQYPEIKYLGDSGFCGGTIISPDRVLTAGHCLVDRKTMELKNHHKIVVTAGTPYRLVQKDPNAQVIPVDKFVVHSEFHYGVGTADIGLVILARPIMEDGVTAQRINLPIVPSLIGAVCTVVGWGRLYPYGPSPDEILYSTLMVLEASFCHVQNFGDGMLCAGDPGNFMMDACEGDSGSGLIINDTIVGIVSFGAGCGVPFHPGIYTDVWYYRSWVETNSSKKNLSNFLFFIVMVIVFI